MMIQKPPKPRGPKDARHVAVRLPCGCSFRWAWEHNSRGGYWGRSLRGFCAEAARLSELVDAEERAGNDNGPAWAAYRQHFGEAAP